jgi:hypothetical protein
MKILSLKLAFTLVILNLAEIGGVAQETVSSSGLFAAQAIQQAPDPSAAVAAYANGVATDRQESAIHAAYVARMIDFGLPEMAYRQAQTLTTLEPKNGLAWAVVAHVDARRGNMEEALSSINLGGQSAPDNRFVQRTAGEILAWYDTKADQSRVPDETKTGLARLREVVGNRSDFATAYSTAKKAYQTETSSTQPTIPAPAPVAPPPAQAQQPATPSAAVTGPLVEPPYALGPEAYPQAVASPFYYANDYFYDSGPGWIEPSPAWWWRPSGFFVGFDFFPFPSVFVFDNHRHFRGGHDGGFERRRADGQFFNGQRDRRIAQSGAVNSRNSAAFFGSTPRPDPRLRSDQTESRFRTNPGLLSPGAAIRQGPTFSRPGTSSSSPVTPLPVPNPAIRQKSAVSGARAPTFAAPPVNPAVGRISPPLPVPNPSVGRGIPITGRNNTTVGTPITPRLSAPLVGPERVPTPAIRSSSPAFVQRAPVVPRMASPSVMRSAPPLPMPNPAIRSAPSFSAPSHVSGGGLHMGGAGSGGGFQAGGGHSRR